MCFVKLTGVLTNLLVLGSSTAIGCGGLVVLVLWIFMYIGIILVYHFTDLFDCLQCLF